MGHVVETWMSIRVTRSHCFTSNHQNLCTTVLQMTLQGCFGTRSASAILSHTVHELLATKKLLADRIALRTPALELQQLSR